MVSRSGWSSKGNSGIAYIHGFITNTNRGATLGTRLAYKGDIVIE